jgi:hypothetical protein
LRRRNQWLFVSGRFPRCLAPKVRISVQNKHASRARDSPLKKVAARRRQSRTACAAPLQSFDFFNRLLTGVLLPGCFVATDGRDGVFENSLLDFHLRADWVGFVDYLVRVVMHDGARLVPVNMHPPTND